MLVYVSGRYTGTIDANIQAARAVAIALWEHGHTALCPHLNTQHFEQDCKASYEDYIRGDLEMVARCDALVMVAGWEESNGAKIERDYALGLGIPVFQYPEMPENNLTEQRCPKQSRAFLELVMQMYRVHLAKNADYSPANILATGEIGLTTRLWDKVARLMNLQGFRFKVEYEGLVLPKAPKHESIDDTLQDAAVYAVIGLLLRRGLWGK
jgi:hypothetical protein